MPTTALNPDNADRDDFRPPPSFAHETEATETRPAAISIQNLSKTYPVPLARFKQLLRRKSAPPAEALRDVSFDVRPGEIFGIIGRNGAGKTTLTKIIATLVQPTSGAVTVCGFDSVRQEQRVREQIGLAGAEERSFYWRLTVEQNLRFFARLYGLAGEHARRRIAELIERFELEPRRRFGELSTGNKQRMAVARALLNRPPILLLDEPTRSLDPVAAARMRSLISSLARSQPPATILLTSHNLAEVEELCERVAVISRGRIRALDTPQNLRDKHRQQERARLTARGISAARASQILAGEFPDAGVTEAGDAVAVSFTRQAGDERFDRCSRLLQEGGAQLISFGAERATLLDVLEVYEREHGARGTDDSGDDEERRR